MVSAISFALLDIENYIIEDIDNKTKTKISIEMKKNKKLGKIVPGRWIKKNFDLFIIVIS